MPITPDDPRHGSTPGYHAGCRCPRCRRSMADYEKRTRLNRLQGTMRATPALGSQRRIRALMRLGWTATDIATHLGWPHRNRVLRILNGQKGKPCLWLERATVDAILTVYDDLSMRIPEPNRYRARTAATAAGKGWPPPLAWDDPDDPDETPEDNLPGARDHDDVDDATVDRVLAGEVLPTTRAEKDIIVARWIARGGSEKALCVKHGWKTGRYGRRDELGETG